MAKVCTKCGLEQPEVNFSKDSTKSDGLRHVCKNCNKTYWEAHWETHSGQIRERNKQYSVQHRELIRKHRVAHRAAHIEKLLEQELAYRVTHKEKIRVRGQTYRTEHPELVHQQSKTWNNNNKERLHQLNKVWRDNNKDMLRKKDAARAKSHPEAAIMKVQTRRARKANLESTLTPTQWKRILDDFNNTCAYCNTGDKALHQEHFIPLTSGGEYGINNIIPACGCCNSSKGAKSFWEWYPTFKHYSKERERKIMRFLHYVGDTQQLKFFT